MVACFDDFNDKSLTPCHDSVNKILCNSPTENGGVAKSTAWNNDKKSDFGPDEIKLIGQKLKQLFKMKGVDATEIAREAFPEKTQEGSKQFMKRIVGGSMKRLKKEVVQEVLDAIGMTWTEFENFNPTLEFAPTCAKKLLEGSMDKVLSELWPEGDGYVKMYAQAKAMGDEKLAKAIRERMAESMVKAANDIKRKR